MAEWVETCKRKEICRLMHIERQLMFNNPRLRNTCDEDEKKSEPHIVNQRTQHAACVNRLVQYAKQNNLEPSQFVFSKLKIQLISGCLQCSRQTWDKTCEEWFEQKIKE